jgi:gliding motility-associated lipoprotein GldH
MKIDFFYFILITLVAFAACEQKHVFNEFKTVDIKGWKSTDTLSYLLKTEESDLNYRYSISVRHSKEYEFSNLWLKVLIKGNGTDTSFRYEIPLFKNDGKPYGKSSGTLCTQTVPLKTKLPFYKKGVYTLSIIQLMRKDPLDGISDIGLIVDKK